MTVSIRITGIDALQRKLGQDFRRVLRPPMQRAVLLLQNEMANYPPKRAGSKYIRGYGFQGGPRTSERLGQKWTTEVTDVAGGVQGKVGNNVSYAPLVQSERFQARVHRGRWQTEEQVLRRRLAQIERFFQVAVDAALR